MSAKNTPKPEVTELPELDALFQPRASRSRTLRSVPMLPGESYEDAVRRQDERIARIKAANAKATGEQA